MKVLGVLVGGVVLVLAIAILVFGDTSRLTHREVTKSLGVYGAFGTASLPQMVAASDVIARVRFVSVEPVGVRSRLSVDASNGFFGYAAALEYTFSVVEYLKGSGGAQFKAVAYGGDYRLDRFKHIETQAEAQTKARELLDARDSRWDDLEQLAFFRHDPNASHYYLGLIHPDHPDYVNVTVASREFKALLPAVGGPTTSTSTPATVSEQATTTPTAYLFADPLQVDTSISQEQTAATSTRVALGDSPIPTVTLEMVRSHITELSAWVARSGGTVEADRCVRIALAWDREMEELQYQRFDRELESGRPAGSDAYILDGTKEIIAGLERRNETPDPTTWSEVWYTGRDAHLFGYRIPGFATLMRPLPAGEYRLFMNWRWRSLVVCDYYPEAQQNKLEYVLTVTSPPNTLAESFFDPFASSTAIIGTTTVGIISWQTSSAGSRPGRVTADLDIDVTRHVLDFIAVDGTVSLSLDVADATDDSGTLVWSLATQPWSPGDKLMLRIRKADNGEVALQGQ